MKKSLLLILALATSVMTGCDKCSDPDPVPDPETPEEYEPAIYRSWTYTADQFSSFYGRAFDDYCDYLSEYIPVSSLVKYNLSNFVASHKSAMDSTVAEETGLTVSEAAEKWTIQRYNFTYGSTSYSGDPIILSAALIVPAVSIEGFHHKLDAISLCPSHMFIDSSCCPTGNATVLMGRVMYNHAVIVPDYQGRGVTADMTYSCLHTHDQAIQSIDAVTAAGKLLKKLGYEYKEGAGLYNVGVSEGGEKSYEIQKQIENDITEEEKEELNLLHTFAANGSYDHVQYVKDKIARVEYTDQKTFEEEMEILKNAFECLTEDEKQGYDASILYSREILAEDGKTLNAEHPVFSVLEKAMERNNIPYNWSPRTPLRLAGSYEDSTIKLSSHALPAYGMLKNHPDGSENHNISLNAFHTPVAGVISELAGERYMIAHIMADMICFVHAIEYEDPSSNDISNCIF